MNKADLIKEIEKTAKEANATEIEIITAMQGQCAKLKNEDMLETLSEIKWDYIVKANPELA